MNKREAFITGIVIISFLFILFSFLSFKVISTGEVGVQSLLGQVYDEPLMPGFHLRNPFSYITTFNTKTEKDEEQGVIPSSEMLSMKLHTTINYHINPAMAPNIVATLGAYDYESKFLAPHFRSAIREVTSGYRAEQFFSHDRTKIAEEIKARLKQTVETKGFVIESVMLKDVRPPASITEAIEKKQQQEQEAEAMKFRLKKERLEAERKAIEAKGIQKFQDIVRQGIDDRLLAWKGIEATETLAKSPNAKVIIIGNKDTKGLPLMIGDK